MPARDSRLPGLRAHGPQAHLECAPQRLVPLRVNARRCTRRGELHDAKVPAIFLFNVDFFDDNADDNNDYADYDPLACPAAWF